MHRQMEGLNVGRDAMKRGRPRGKCQSQCHPAKTTG
jgi:hypothetical protein